MKRRVGLLLVLLATGWIATEGSRDQGQATTLADLIKPVDVTITDQRITIEADQVREEFVRGSIGDFRVANESSERRNFVVGVERTQLLAPGERVTLRVEFPVRGVLPYRVTVNRVAGLSGLIRVL